MNIYRYNFASITREAGVPSFIRYNTTAGAGSQGQPWTPSGSSWRPIFEPAGAAEVVNKYRKVSAAPVLTQQFAFAPLPYDKGGRLASYRGLDRKTQITQVATSVAKRNETFYNTMVSAAARNPDEFDHNMAALSDLIAEAEAKRDTAALRKYSNIRDRIVAHTFPGIAPMRDAEGQALRRVTQKVGKLSGHVSMGQNPLPSAGSSQLLGRMRNSVLSQPKDMRASALDDILTELTGGVYITGRTRDAAKGAAKGLSDVPLIMYMQNMMSEVIGQIRQDESLRDAVSAESMDRGVHTGAFADVTADIIDDDLDPELRRASDLMNRYYNNMMLAGGAQSPLDLAYYNAHAENAMLDLKSVGANAMNTPGKMNKLRQYGRKAGRRLIAGMDDIPDITNPAVTMSMTDPYNYRRVRGLGFDLDPEGALRWLNAPPESADEADITDAMGSSRTQMVRTIERAYADLLEASGTREVASDSEMRGMIQSGLRKLTSRYLEVSPAEADDALRLLRGRTRPFLQSRYNKAAESIVADVYNMLHGGVRLMGAVDSPGAIMDRSLVGRTGHVVGLGTNKYGSVMYQVAINDALGSMGTKLKINEGALFNAYKVAKGSSTPLEVAERAKAMMRSLGQAYDDAYVTRNIVLQEHASQLSSKAMAWVKGVLIRYNDPSTRDLVPKGIVKALNLDDYVGTGVGFSESAGQVLADFFGRFPGQKNLETLMRGMHDNPLTKMQSGKDFVLEHIGNEAGLALSEIVDDDSIDYAADTIITRKIDSKITARFESIAKKSEDTRDVVEKKAMKLAEYFDTAFKTRQTNSELDVVMGGLGHTHLYQMLSFAVQDGKIDEKRFSALLDVINRESRNISGDGSIEGKMRRLAYAVSNDESSGWLRDSILQGRQRIPGVTQGSIHAILQQAADELGEDVSATVASELGNKPASAIFDAVKEANGDKYEEWSRRVYSSVGTLIQESDPHRMMQEMDLQTGGRIVGRTISGSAEWADGMEDRVIAGADAFEDYATRELMNVRENLVTQVVNILKGTKNDEELDQLITALDSSGIDERTIMAEMASLNADRKNALQRAFLARLHESIERQKLNSAKVSELSKTLSGAIEVEGMRGVQWSTIRAARSTKDALAEEQLEDFMVATGFDEKLGRQVSRYWKVAGGQASEISDEMAHALTSIQYVSSFSVGPANQMVYGSAEIMNMAMAANGIDKKTMTEVYRRLMPDVAADVTVDEIFQAMAHGNRLNQQPTNWMTAARDLVGSALDGDDLIRPESTAQLDPFQLSMYIADRYRRGETIGDDVKEIFSTVAAEVDSIVDMRRRGVGSTDMLTAAKNFRQAVDMDPLKGLETLMDMWHQAPRLSRIGVGAIAISGLSAAYSALNDDPIRTDEFLQYDHPGSAGIARVAQNGAGYGQPTAGRSIPGAPAGARQESVFKGLRGTVTLEDNMDSMSTNDINNMMDRI